MGDRGGVGGDAFFAPNYLSLLSFLYLHLYLYSKLYSHLRDWDSDGVEQDVFFAPTRGSKPIYHLYLALPPNVLAIQETWRGGGVLLFVLIIAFTSP